MYIPVCVPIHQSTSEKKVYSERSKFFPFKLDSFSKGSKNNFDIAVSLESVSIRLHLYHSLGKISRRQTDDIFLISRRKHIYISKCRLLKNSVYSHASPQLRPPRSFHMHDIWSHGHFVFQRTVYGTIFCIS